MVNRKRKHAAGDEEASQQSITAFGAIGKPRTSQDSSKKRKTVVQDQAEFMQPTMIKSTGLSNKRKRNSDESEAEHANASDQEGATNSHRERRTPRSKRMKSTPPVSPKETPSKSTAALFDRLKIGANVKPIALLLSTGPVGYETPPDTPKSPSGPADDLPTELQDMLALHSAFLSALSIYYAHNGTSSPADVKVLLPLITKNWKKRAASLEDLRTILAITDDNESTFSLRDYGKAGICLAKSQPRGRAVKRSASFVDEVELNARFEDSLRKLWIDRQAMTALEDRLAPAFLQQLPLAKMEKDASVEKTAPVFARGKQRLADLKSSQAGAKEAVSAPAQVTEVQRSAGAVQSRGTTLLDRILAKQAYSATLPAGPTKDQLERRAALQRVEEIARVLELLATGRSRCSFSLQAIAQQLQQSLRNPISKADIERCLDLMASEITPGFVSLVRNGSFTGVVIMKGNKVGLEEMRRRVQVAGGGSD